MLGLGVELGQPCPWSQVCSRSLEVGGHRATRTAPLGPTVYQERDVIASNMTFQGWSVDIERLKWKQSTSTIAANWSVGDSMLGDAVTGAARRTD